MPTHDPAIKRIYARSNHTCYGMGLGIILLDQVYPGFPGDVRNASAYPFPIQYEIAEGVDVKNLLGGKDKTDLLEPVLNAARKLERIGCRAIAAECGYFAWFQKEIASAVKVPVFASSLLQVPLAQMVIGSDRVVGILVAVERQLHDRHLASVGVRSGNELCRPWSGGPWEDAAIRKPLEEEAGSDPDCRLRPGRARLCQGGPGFCVGSSEHGRDGAGMHWLPALRAGGPAGNRHSPVQLVDTAGICLFSRRSP
ncbi:hypothetical protein [Bradyrhizobium sp. BR 1433]|uniref:hypothetical protein n=1 Tax=Bradyrhizobium sp. BR 1433 TaxID=3447967 RepID=UPI003EE66DC4